MSDNANVGRVFNLTGGGSGSGSLKLVGISVKAPPKKTVYKSGESFESDGMIIEADYGYGLKSEVTGYSVSPTLLTDDVTEVTITYLSFRFRGFMVQCINELPRMKDKSDSFYRRQLFVPFNKSFTGIAREYIKDDYVRRKDVLEYVLHKVLKLDISKSTVWTASEANSKWCETEGWLHFV